MTARAEALREMDAARELDALRDLRALVLRTIPSVVVFDASGCGPLFVPTFASWMAIVHAARKAVKP